MSVVISDETLQATGMSANELKQVARMKCKRNPGMSRIPLRFIRATHCLAKFCRVGNLLPTRVAAPTPETMPRYR
jgi:hypothetical protein